MLNLPKAFTNLQKNLRFLLLHLHHRLQRYRDAHPSQPVHHIRTRMIFLVPGLDVP